MVDYAVNGDFDIFKTDHDSLSEVEGLEEFEQNLIIKLDDLLRDYAGNLRDTDTLIERVTLVATRLAREEDFLDSISRINVSDLPERAETLAIEIVYESSQTFNETL